MPRHKVFHNLMFLFMLSSFLLCPYADAYRCDGMDYSFTIKLSEKISKDDVGPLLAVIPSVVPAYYEVTHKLPHNAHTRFVSNLDQLAAVRLRL